LKKKLKIEQNRKKMENGKKRKQKLEKKKGLKRTQIPN